ncbi:Rpn family recombination-promoting nuclease/putative transposase [Halanaerobium congolense]|uniref:Rpn family recombination-promoting nuclease/putative transposase n=1 Tax=Halanaerobium congolense TaxID=54121 RepID=UPI000AD732F5|nr:Rpn family recombination-promoting nuclease/putative transposase [Halanaerobium congolense]
MAVDFLENYLPNNILKEIDLTDIKVAKDSFVDEELEESFSDILYNVSMIALRKV